MPISSVSTSICLSLVVATSLGHVGARIELAPPEGAVEGESPAEGELAPEADLADEPESGPEAESEPDPDTEPEMGSEATAEPDPSADVEADAAPQSGGPAAEPDFGGEFEDEGAAGPASEPDFGGEFEDAGEADGPRDVQAGVGDEPFEGPAPEPSFGEPDDYDPLLDSPEWAKAQGWSRAGIVAISTGTALVIGGIAMGLSDPGAPGSGNNNFEDARNRAALLMGVPGALLLGGGAAMLAHGQVQKKKLRAAASVSAAPSVARTSVGGSRVRTFGLVVSGRF